MLERVFLVEELAFEVLVLAFLGLSEKILKLNLQNSVIQKFNYGNFRVAR